MEEWYWISGREEISPIKEKSRMDVLGPDDGNPWESRGRAGHQEPWMVLEKGGSRKKVVPYEEGVPFVGWLGGGGSDGGCTAIPEREW